MKSFLKKVGIVITHQYFTSGLGSGLSLIATPQCQSALKSHQLLVKNTLDGVEIFREEEKGTAFAAGLPAGTVAFDFLLSSVDPQLLNYTLLPEKNNNEMYLFTNEKGENTFKISFVSKTNFLNSGTSTPLGLLRMFFNFSEPVILTLPLDARSMKWRYYVLTGTTFPELSIDGSVDGVNFVKKKTVLKSDKLGEALITGYPNSVVSVFESDRAITLTSGGRKNIQLKKKGSNAVVIANLANPAPEDQGLKIINLLQ